MSSYILNGKYHRLDGPALEYPNGTKFWMVHGKYHRTDGAAIEYSNGRKEYWLNGKQYSFEEWNKVRKMTWIL